MSKESNNKAEAYWQANVQALRDLGLFEGAKGVVYQVFRDLESQDSAAAAEHLPKLPINFDLTHALPDWHAAPSYARRVTVEFDGAEGGAVWLNDTEDESVAIRGPEAMRELARMLNAFADGYTGPLEAATNEA